jgi:hypothetical protein
MSANETVENNITNNPMSSFPRFKNADFIPCSFLCQAMFCTPANAG